MKTKHFFGKLLTKNICSPIMNLTNECSHKKGGTKMRIVNMKKFLRSILFIIGIIVVISLLLSNSSLSYGEVEYITIYISQGETLWGIASELQQTNGYYRGRDIRFIIDDLVNINNLNTKTLAVNQPLQIPTI